MELSELIHFKGYVLPPTYPPTHPPNASSNQPTTRLGEAWN